MAYLIEHKCALTAYSMMLDLCARKATRKSDMSEVQDVCLSLEIDEYGAERFFGFANSLSCAKPFAIGFEKARRAYVREEGNITKPSYIGRIRAFKFLKPGSNNWKGIDQISRLLERFALAPQASNLSISVFHPDDLIDGFRPGYVPCLSFIDVKYRGATMRMKFFFRSCDIASVGIFDVFFCLKLQHEVVRLAREIAPNVPIADQATTFFFSRAFFYTRRKHDIFELQEKITRSLK